MFTRADSQVVRCRVNTLLLISACALFASVRPPQADAAPATQPAASALGRVKLAVGMKRVEAERLIAEATGIQSKYDLHAMDTSREVAYRDGPLTLIVQYKPGIPAPLVALPQGGAQHLPPVDGEVISWRLEEASAPGGGPATRSGAARRSVYSDAAEGIIRNDIVWRDTAGNEIWCNGGHILQQRDTFYWVGYDTGPGRWPWRINLYSSRNLADWKFENTVIRMEGKFAAMGWAGRPALLHCAATGKYIIVFEADSPRQWKRHKVGFAVCDRIDGKYELAGAEYPEPDRSTGDQSVYQEGDRAYLLATLDKDIAGRKYLNQSLAIYELSKDFLRVERKVYEGFDNVSGDTKRIPRDHPSREASHIIKVDGVYYWFSSALVGWNSSATLYATARDLAGPWSQLRLLKTDPSSEDSYNTQHDFILPVIGSQATTWVYVGDRYSQWTNRGAGRNIFLPLSWKEGEPTLRWHASWRIDPETGRHFVEK